MPTGYTHTIKDGISFNTFIMKCTRAMGVCVTMQDESQDKEIPNKFEPSDYDSKAILKAQNDLKRLQGIDSISAISLAQSEYDKEIVRTEKAIKKNSQLKEQYESMLKQVKKWEPPTSEHIGLKDFMIQQIEDSIKFDCDIKYLNHPKLLSGNEWLKKETSKVLHDIKYHTKKNKKENDLTDSKNIWLNQLRESL